MSEPVAGLCRCWLGWAMTVAVGFWSVPAASTAKSIVSLTCMGQGAPTVVFIPGLGGGAQEWGATAPTVSRRTRVCVAAPSRASARAPSIEQEVGALHGALIDRHVVPPYVVVGHSTGGVQARIFARRYAGELAALVLIESTPARELLYGPPVISYAGDRLAVHQAARSLLATPRLGSLPLIVIERGQERDHTWALSQAQLSLSSRQGLLIVATRSDHGVPYEQPRLVVVAAELAATASRPHRLPSRCPIAVQVAGGRCVALGTVIPTGSGPLKHVIAVVGVVAIGLGLVVVRTFRRRSSTT